MKIQNKIYDLSKGCDLILRREEKNGIKNFAIRYSSAFSQNSKQNLRFIERLQSNLKEGKRKMKELKISLLDIRLHSVKLDEIYFINRFSIKIRA